MNKETLTVFVRAILQAVAGSLVGKGVLDESATEPIIGGAVAAATVLWSIAEKKRIKSGNTGTIPKP